MAMFSKNVQNILFTLAVLIILYGAYKALFPSQEGLTKKAALNTLKGMNKCKRRKFKKTKRCAKKICKRKNSGLDKDEFKLTFRKNNKGKKEYKCKKILTSGDDASGLSWLKCPRKGGAKLARDGCTKLLCKTSGKWLCLKR